MIVLKAPKDLPEWFVISNSKTTFKVKDLAELFNVTYGTFMGYVNREVFPEERYKVAVSM